MRTQKFSLIFRTLTKILSKTMLHVKMQKNHKVLSQLLAAVLSSLILVTECWTHS